jgi:hypothetical protein
MLDYNNIRPASGSSSSQKAYTRVSRCRNPAANSADRLQKAIRGRLEFDPQQPVEVKVSRSQKFLQRFAIRSVEFREHFAFLHIENHAACGRWLTAQQAPRNFLGALARQAGERVLREVAGHSVSDEIWICKRKGRHRKSRLAGKKQIDTAPEAAREMRANWTGVQVTIPKTGRRNRGPRPRRGLKLRFEVTGMRPILRRAFMVILFAALGFVAGVSARGPVGNLTGTVVDAKGKPVADATVTMQSSDGKKPYATHTDADGHFQFTRYETGQYDLRAYSSGMFSDWAKRISIRSQKTTALTLRLPPPADQSVSVTTK